LRRIALLGAVGASVVAGCTGNVAVEPDEPATGGTGASGGAGGAVAGQPASGAGGLTTAGASSGVGGASGAGGAGGAGAGGAGGAGGGANAGSGGVSASAGMGAEGGTVAGMGSAAGAGGAAGSVSGSGGTAGQPAAGSGGQAGGAGGGAAVRSAGCGVAATETLGQWVEKPSLMVRSVARRWWVWLPMGYDPMRAYPVVHVLHGCGDETNNVPVQRESTTNAILVRGVATTDCWDTAPNGPDVEFVRAMVTASEAAHCIDSSHRFAVGYSSGSWLINAIECADGSLFRAAGSVAGGAVRRNNCMGPIARVFIHDHDDPENSIDGSILERDRLLTMNGCDATAEPVAEEPSPCQRYQGCMPGYPVIWCETTGQMHGRQDNLAAEASWKLFTEL
jgi:poly(3-hydroxybutyrate) depolymerase